MRLKEDSSSYNAIGLKKKYSQVQDVRFKSKKDTKKWCRGKVGTLHEYEHTVPRNSIRLNWIKYDICKNCGRQETKNASYWCRHHKVWDKTIHWRDDHEHEETIQQPTNEASNPEE